VIVDSKLFPARLGSSTPAFLASSTYFTFASAYSWPYLPLAGRSLNVGNSKLNGHSYGVSLLKVYLPSYRVFVYLKS
jgi:hypothetical protein